MSPPTITATSFPRQGAHLGTSVEVCFQCDTTQTVTGIVVRDDVEAPFETMILLVPSGRIVRGPECQYRPLEVA